MACVLTLGACGAPSLPVRAVAPVPTPAAPPASSPPAPFEGNVEVAVLGEAGGGAWLWVRFSDPTSGVQACFAVARAANEVAGHAVFSLPGPVAVLETTLPPSLTGCIARAVGTLTAEGLPSPPPSRVYVSAW
jgi:hypothetical protein